MKKNNKIKCVDAIVDFLHEKGINTVFDLSGGMIVYLEDAISRKKGMECFPMHHEQAAGFAAEGFARQSQNFGVAISTSGPGALNMVTAIGSCYFDSTPSMFITGNVNTSNIKKNSKIRQDGFQETDIVSVVKPITKYAVIVKDPKDVIYELEKAHFIMKDGRNGPVLIDIPINNQYAEIDIDSIKHFYGSREHKALLKSKEHESVDLNNKISKLEKYLAKSKAPVVLVGNGVRLSNTIKELKDFVEKNNLPVVTSLMGLDSFFSSGNLVGYIGSNGNREANIVLANADLIIVLGSRLDVRQTGGASSFNSDAVLIHVDIDKSVINYDIKSKLSLNIDLTLFFKNVKKIKTEKKVKWFDFIKSVKEHFERKLSYQKDNVDPNTFIRDLSLISQNNTTVVFDVGQNQMWGAQSWIAKDGQRLLFSGGMGSMGFSLPAAIGASLVDKSRQIISINGDGGFQMNIQELETISRNNLPISIIVLNNSSLGMVREFQDLYLNSNYQSTVIGYSCPNLKEIARAFGVDYLKISNLKKDDKRLKNIAFTDKAVIVEVELNQKTPLTPKVVFGHKLDDQSPYLDNSQKKILEDLKRTFKND